MSAEPHIVIIGGGFSGAAVAIELLRLAAERGARDAAGAAPVPRGRGGLLHCGADAPD